MKAQLPGWVSGTVIALVTVGALYLLGISTKPQGESVEATVDTPAPAISGTLTDGKPFRLSDYRGKVVLVNFWGTWCPPCRDELPDLIALQAKYGARGFTVLGLAENHDSRLTEPQYRAALAAFMAKQGIVYPNAPVPEGAKTAFGIEAFPTSFLIDKQGKIRYPGTVGGVSREVYAARIEKLL